MLQWRITDLSVFQSRNSSSILLWYLIHCEMMMRDRFSAFHSDNWFGWLWAVGRTLRLVILTTSRYWRCDRLTICCWKILSNVKDGNTEVACMMTRTAGGVTSSDRGWRLVAWSWKLKVEASPYIVHYQHPKSGPWKTTPTCFRYVPDNLVLEIQGSIQYPSRLLRLSIGCKHKSLLVMAKNIVEAQRFCQGGLSLTVCLMFSLARRILGIQQSIASLVDIRERLRSWHVR